MYYFLIIKATVLVIAEDGRLLFKMMHAGFTTNPLQLYLIMMWKISLITSFKINLERKNYQKCEREDG